jgi:hypothetical protein
MESTRGLVYVLLNDSFPGMVKIGMTQKTVEERMRHLHTTGVPTAFRCFCAKLVNDCRELEQSILSSFQPFRIEGREFLKV